MNKRRFTIVIPTRERGDVLGAALRSVCAQDYDGLDILVSDNCSTDATADVVRAANDPRVRYVNTGKRVSMSHNWEFALSHVPVDDRYVMVIGDDDGILPGALHRIASLIVETKAKALNSTYVTYIWPNEGNGHRGRLLVPMRRGHEVRDTRKWLRRALEGRAWYTALPMLYAGGAHHMSLIDAVRRRTGAFFHSCQPDIFSSVALSCVTERYAFSHEPFAIAGHSRHSNGASWGASASAKSAGDVLQPNQIFESEPNIPWHPDIPVLPGGKVPFSVNLLVYESYLQAGALHGDCLKIEKIDAAARIAVRRIPDQAGLDAWIKLFVARHGIDPDAMRRKRNSLQTRETWDRFIENAQAFMDVYRLEPRFGVRMRDVHEAGIVADTILKTRPTRLRSYAGTIAKRLRVGRGQVHHAEH